MWRDDALEIFDDLNLGVGTATPEGGLVVPVIHRAQTLDFEELAAQLRDLTNRARTGKLTRKDMEGGTFTLSNHGVSGSLLAAPIIIPQGQSAIVGAGKLQRRVMVRKDETLQSLPMIYVTLTV